MLDDLKAALDEFFAKNSENIIDVQYPIKYRGRWFNLTVEPLKEEPKK